MAAQARIQNLSGGQFRKGNDRRFPSVRRNMQFPWAMATFASGIGRRFFARSHAFKMRVLEKSEPDVGMTGLAHSAPDISILRRIGGETPAGRYQAEDNSESDRWAQSSIRL